jgi:acetoacetyl-CoA synthetase
MWNYLVMTLVVGATIVTYDGSPFAPTSIIWDLVDEHKINGLGISPRYIQVLIGAKYSPKRDHSLASLTKCGFAGAPVKPEICASLCRRCSGSA